MKICSKCGKESNEYSPVCEYCSEPMKTCSIPTGDAAHTIEEQGKALHSELKKQSIRLKKCPFCAEEIQEEAIKCRYCGELIKAPGNAKTLNTLITKFMGVMGLLFILVLICISAVNLVKGSSPIKYDNKLSPALKRDPVKADYVKKYITVTDVGTLEETDPGQPSAAKYFYGTIKNTGDKTLVKLVLAIYYFDKNGRCIAEGSISPILGVKGKPNSVKPGSSKDFKLPIMNTVPEWSGKLREKVSDVEFL